MLKIVKVLDKYIFICKFAVFNYEPTMTPQERGGGGDRLRGKRAVRPRVKYTIIGVATPRNETSRGAKNLTKTLISRESAVVNRRCGSSRLR